MDETIFIASSALDESAWRPVADLLSRRGFNLLIYESDKVANGQSSLGIEISNEAGWRFHYCGQPVDLSSIRAGWYRRPNTFSLALDDRAKQFSLDIERRAIQSAMWERIPNSAWLNPPKRLAHADHKLTQLTTAVAVGFAVPRTIVTNSWQPIKESLPAEVVFKPSYALSYRGDQMRLLYTTRFENHEQLPVEGLPFPGIWQPFLLKSREWRVTVVGERSFEAAIYTDSTARDDWRRHQLDSKVRFERGDFPADQRSKCMDYLRAFGLKFGAFDFVEDPDGKITFLECNPNGQFGWIEDELGYPISEAISDELAAIAAGNSP